MASLLRKLLRKPPPPPSLQTLASLSKSRCSPSLLQSPVPSSIPSLVPNSNPSTTLCPFPHNNAGVNPSLRLHLSFPHCFHLEPISLSGMVQSDAAIAGELDSGAEGDGPSVWADSVKKKRKRKMNKHKYKKLRKRLRRQS
ncbi:hypothetical protein AXF42_Ash012756 [Apostasia shenzhenica]|uniref:Small ribosomal subunit protein mS38 n=1 Tax=Apostasia shenzhenica TaxID=1088818 RepID=A0A2I0AMD2_9ASPA|nr:hypothetical protein AXF42_Ash012756 [Apostasia shenzhenica]